MRITAVYAPTVREIPADADTLSYQLLVRAGMLRKSAHGLYTYLPLGVRVLQKIADLIRNEVRKAGGQEVLLPSILPSELLEESGRWDEWGDELFRLKDRNNRNFCLAPGHEESITTLLRADIKSYRQLPLFLYQIGEGFRDEGRLRYGPIRSREFMMAELFSFDRNEEGLEGSYANISDVYARTLKQLGLAALSVEASASASNESHEYVVLRDGGEAEVCHCSACGYAADIQHAALTVIEAEGETVKALELVYTPNCKSMEEVAQFLGFKPEHAVKTLAFATDKGPVLALVRGDHEVSETKLKNVLGCRSMAMADSETLERIGSFAGYIGPIGIKNATVVADSTVMQMINTECGGNKLDHHYINVNPGRDFTPSHVADIRLMRKGDPCPRCSAQVAVSRGIAVARTAKLGVRYSESLGLRYKDEAGAEKPVLMGIYGLGLGRAMAAVVESNHDDNGIVWPANIAPFEVIIVPVSAQDEAQSTLAEDIYKKLMEAGIAVALDDRDERAGSKFVDADLIGYPVRITIGPKGIKNQVIEVKIRRSGEVKFLPLDNYLNEIKSILEELKE